MPRSVRYGQRTPRQRPSTVTWRCTHRKNTEGKGDMLLQALCRRQTGGHTITGVKTRITEERHPGSRISQAKARERELVLCGSGKQWLRKRTKAQKRSGRKEGARVTFHI